MAALGIGAAIGLSAYTMTTAIGAGGMDTAQSAEEFGTYKLLLYPVGGPFAAATRFPRARGRALSIVSGLAQTAALGTTITGIAVLSKYGRHLPPRRQRSLGAALFSTGVATLGATVLAASIVGGTRLRNDSDDPFWRRMVIPIVGGYAAMPATDRYQAKWGAAFLSTVQVAALASTIGGLAIMRRTPRPMTAMALPTRGGAQVSFMARF